MKPALLSLLAATSVAQAAPLPLDKLHLPPGFSISIYAEVENARQLALGRNGTVFVGSFRAGKVHALVNPDNAATASRVIKIADNLTFPSGIAYRDGDLYIAAVNRVLRLENIDQAVAANVLPLPQVVTDQLPADKHHGWKFIDFGPDGLLYIPVGAPCNICEREAPYASIQTLDVTDPEATLQPYALGVRNSVGFDWHPQSGVLWFSDNGGDMLGDDIPPDELNRAPERGLHFGYPYYHAGDIPDPTFKTPRPMTDFVGPAGRLGAHVAPLGVNFYRGKQFPKRYRNQLIVAEHGSWNRSEEAGHVGYRLMSATIEDGRVTDYHPLVSGWLQNNQGWGRPVDTLTLADGSLLISDDRANVVYRLSYSPTK